LFLLEDLNDPDEVEALDNLLASALFKELPAVRAGHVTVPTGTSCTEVWSRGCASSRT